MKKIATKIKRLEDFTGEAWLYRLSPPIIVKADYDGGFNGEVEYIVVSATVALYSGAETYIFPANDKGEVVDWGELDGSYRGGLDHIKALREAGYKPTTEEEG